MATRKKSTKKSPSRPAKAAKRAVKAVAKPAKAPARAKKPAAKSARTVTSAKSAASAKRAAPASSARAKAARASLAAKASARAKVAAPTKAKQADRKAHKPAVAEQAKARKVVAVAKKKPDSVKKGRDQVVAEVKVTAATVVVAAVQPKVEPRPVAQAPAPTPAPAPAPQVEARAPASVAAPVARPARPAAPEGEETQAQKAARSGPPRGGFKPNDYIVYPAHGVGQIVAVEEQEVAGFKLELFVITFVKDKMTLRVPTGKVSGVGMRKLAEPDVVKKSLDILMGRARIKRTMWSRRAQEYESKINSGDLAAIAEVVRDLYRSEAQPEQSYSERQLYEAALDRLAREVAVVQKLTETEALKAIDGQLQRGQRRGVKAPGEAAAPGAGESDVEEAA